MYHYDGKIALEELQEEALPPHPVKLRDMILRTKLGPQDAQLLNHDYQDYLTRFGDLQKAARGILEKIAAGQRKTSRCHLHPQAFPAHKTKPQYCCGAAAATAANALPRSSWYPGAHTRRANRA